MNLDRVVSVLKFIGTQENFASRYPLRAAYISQVLGRGTPDILLVAAGEDHIEVFSWDSMGKFMDIFNPETYADRKSKAWRFMSHARSFHHEMELIHGLLGRDFELPEGYVIVWPEQYAGWTYLPF